MRFFIVSLLFASYGKRHNLKQLIKFSVYFLAITCSQYGVAEEAKILDFDRYVGRIYSDGSGSIAKRFDPKVTESCKTPSCKRDRKNANVNSRFDDSWHFHIKNDEMSDKQIITVRKHPYTISKEFGEIRLTSNIYLWLSLSTKGKEVICVSGHDYPGKNAMIRIDSNPAIKTNTEGCLWLTEDLDSQMKAGSKITIRGYHWPYGYETSKISLGGYTKTTQFLRGERLD